VLPQPPAQINNPVRGYLHYVMGSGNPAVIGPKLQNDLQKLQKCRPWPRTTEPENINMWDFGSSSYPFASLNAAFTVGQFRYTDDGSTTTLSDYYAFPFNSHNWIAAIVFRWWGTPYPVSGSWPTAQ
jgi:hypothetical protein